MHVAVIVNPVSGARGQASAGRRRADLAEAVLAEAGATGAVHVTEAAGHAAALAREAVGRGAALVIAWGGDGTVNEVASALAFRDVALGVVPAGSGNGLARELGVSGPPGRALRAALAGADRRLDVGELGGRLFVNVAGIGLDAEVAARFNARPGGRRGVLPYFALGVRAALRYQAAEYALRIDDEGVVEIRALTLVLANGREYGGGARIAAGARPDDGLLDVVVIGDLPRWQQLRGARRLFTGTLAAIPGVSIRRCRTLEVEAAGPLRFHVDGEALGGPSRLRGRVHAGALRVRAPTSRPR